MRISRFVAAAAAVFVVLATAPAGRAEPLNLRVGWVVYTSTAVPLMLELKSILKHYGKSYVVEPQHVRSTSGTLTALGSGRMDIGTLSYSTLGFAIQNAHLDDLRIISGELEDGNGAHATGQYVVLKDSPIHKVEDLKGKTLASLATGSAVDIAIRAMLRKHGLDDRTDVQFVEVRFPNMKATLLSKKADLVATALPFSKDPQLVKASRVLFTTREAMGGATQLLVWVARAGFLQKNRAVVVDFLEDCLTVTRYLTNPKNHDEVVRIVAKAMKQPEQNLRSWLFTPHDMYRDPSGLLQLGALQRSIDMQHKLGLLKETIKVSDYVDLSHVKEAASRLDK